MAYVEIVVLGRVDVTKLDSQTLNSSMLPEAATWDVVEILGAVLVCRRVISPVCRLRVVWTYDRGSRLERAAYGLYRMSVVCFEAASRSGVIWYEQEVNFGNEVLPP